jgi:hypothetical protein
MNLSDWIGFTGVTILLIAFLLNLLKKLSANSLGYIIMNVVGAGLACLASVMINYIPFIILEGAWTLVSVITLAKVISGKENR